MSPAFLVGRGMEPLDWNEFHKIVSQEAFFEFLDSSVGKDVLFGNRVASRVCLRLTRLCGDQVTVGFEPRSVGPVIRLRPAVPSGS